jgi:hypothetical protein
MCYKISVPILIIIVIISMSLFNGILGVFEIKALCEQAWILCVIFFRWATEDRHGPRFTTISRLLKS